MLEAPRLSALRKIPGLRGLSSDQLDELAGAARDMALPAGAVVQHETTGAPQVAVVVDGRATLWHEARQVGEVAPGDFVANCPPFDVLTRGARVIAQTPMRLITLPPDGLGEFLGDAAITAAMLRGRLARLRPTEGGPSGEPGAGPR